MTENSKNTAFENVQSILKINKCILNVSYSQFGLKYKLQLPKIKTFSKFKSVKIAKKGLTIIPASILKN